MKFKWPKTAMIESTRDDVVAGVQPSLQISHRGQTVTWFEGNHDRLFEVDEILIDEEKRFSFKDGAGETHTLVPMTLELYNKNIKDRTVGKPAFSSLKDLENAMLNEW